MLKISTETSTLRLAAIVLTTLLGPLLLPGQSLLAAPPDEPVSASQAIEAYTAFAGDPLNQLQHAPTFLRYIETHGGEVHVVINGNLLGFMQRDVPAAARAVLYAAYMGGNMQAQLESGDVADQPVAGMAAAVDAYRFLKTDDTELAVQELEYLVPHRGQDTFADAVRTLAEGDAFDAGKPPAGN